MRTRVKTFTDLRDLPRKKCHKNVVGVLNGRGVVFALPGSSSDTAKSFLVVEQTSILLL